MIETNFQLDDQLPWQDAAPGITRKMFGYNDQVMMVKVKFEKDAIGAAHKHEHVQVSYVESGIFELTIANRTMRLQKGDGYFVPPNVEHGALCIEPGVLIDVFHPLRQDFL